VSGQKEFLERITSLLSDAGIPFMVAGSLGSAHYGEPRSTNDIDVIIDPTNEQLQFFISHLNPNDYVSADAVENAIKRRSMFNVIETTTGWKADLIIRKDRPFSVTEFARRMNATLLGVDVEIASPEDIILSKLEWAQRTGSDRQFHDARSVFTTMSDHIDVAYLQKWAGELNLTELLNRILNQ
jgi:hypothetical protein